jgi:hypothetical protein
MNDSQLEIEQVAQVPLTDEQAKTVTAVDDSQVGAQTNEPVAAATLDLSTLDASETDVFGESLDPLQVDTVEGLRPARSGLIGAAGLYGVAMMETTITPEHVEEMLLRPQERSATVASLMQQIKAEEPEITELASKQLLMDPSMSAADKLEAIREMHKGDTTDYNGVQRRVAEVLAIGEFGASDQDDDADWHSVAAQNAESIPTSIGTDPGESEEEQQNNVWAAMAAVYTKADENSGLLDYVEQMTPMGSLPILNATVERIWRGVGVDAKWSAPTSYAAVGASFRELRNVYRKADAKEKERMAQIVMHELKGNTGLFQDSNDLVTMQVLDNIFSEALTGQDKYALEIEKSPAQKKALEDRLTEIAAERSALKYGPGYDQAKVRLKDEENRIEAQLFGRTSSEVADNVFNALDLVGIGATAKGTLAFGTKYLPRLWKSMFSAAPDLAARRVADAVENGETAAQMGMTKADALNVAVPNAGKTERGVNALLELADRQKEAVQALTRQAKPVNLTADERAAALVELSDEIGALTQKQLARPHINFSSVVARRRKRRGHHCGVWQDYQSRVRHVAWRSSSQTRYGGGSVWCWRSAEDRNVGLDGQQVC